MLLALLRRQLQLLFKGLLILRRNVATLKLRVVRMHAATLLPPSAPLSVLMPLSQSLMISKVSKAEEFFGAVIKIRSLNLYTCTTRVSLVIYLLDVLASQSEPQYSLSCLPHGVFASYSARVEDERQATKIILGRKRANFPKTF